MPVDPGPFIKPTFILTGIGPNDDGVFAIEFEEVGYIIGRTAISAEVASQINIIDPYLAIPEDAIELQDIPPAGIGAIGGECLAIPANGILRK